MLLFCILMHALSNLFINSLINLAFHECLPARLNLTAAALECLTSSNDGIGVDIGTLDSSISP